MAGGRIGASNGSNRAIVLLRGQTPRSPTETSFCKSTKLLCLPLRGRWVAASVLPAPPHRRGRWRLRPSAIGARRRARPRGPPAVSRSNIPAQAPAAPTLRVPHHRVRNMADSFQANVIFPPRLANANAPRGAWAAGAQDQVTLQPFGDVHRPYRSISRYRSARPRATGDLGDAGTHERTHVRCFGRRYRLAADDRTNANHIPRRRRAGRQRPR